MYAVIEFSRKQCSIVPYSWLTMDEKYCNWPNNVTQPIFDRYVLDKKDPLKSWKKFEVVRIIYMSVEYEQAESKLKKTVEESTSAHSDGDGDVEQYLVVKTVEHVEEQNFDEAVNDETADLSKKRKINEKEISDLDSSSDEDVPVPSKIKKATPSKKKNQKRTEDISGVDDLSDSSVENSTSQPLHSQISSATGTPSLRFQYNSPSTSSMIIENEHTDLENSKFGKLILTKMETIIATQNHQCILLDQLTKVQSATAVQQLIIPADLPNMPVANRADYRALQTFLAQEEKFAYLKCRLATIGGSCVRYVVMGMLKFLLTNEIAMKFNWAGQNNKKPFKFTRVMKVIREAVKYHYRGQDGIADLTDKEMDSAVKDWLKLAKARLSYSSQKK